MVALSAREVQLEPRGSGPAPIFRILGRIQLKGNDRPAEIVGAKARTFLVTMLLRANETVSLERISETLWDGEPPRSATANIRTYAHLLRRRIGRAARLTSRPGGYQMIVSPRDCDHACFLNLAAAGRKALLAGDIRSAVTPLESALAMWDGDRAAVGISRNGPLLTELDHLDQERTRAAEDLAEAYLRLGEARAALRDLRELLAGSPVSSRGWTLCMRAYQMLGELHNVADIYRQAASAYRKHLGIALDPRLHRTYLEIMGG